MLTAKKTRLIVRGFSVVEHHVRIDAVADLKMRTGGDAPQRGDRLREINRSLGDSLS
jgi:hypothetical protein